MTNETNTNKGNRSFKQKLLGIFPTLIILFVTGLAFTGGFIQADASIRAQILNNVVESKNDHLNALQQTNARIIADEIQAFYRGFDKLQETTALITSYLELIPTLTVNENQSYQDRIAHGYSVASQYLIASWSAEIVLHFEVNEFTSPFVIDVYPELDANYEITATQYSNAIRPIEFIEPVDFLTTELLDPAFIILEAGQENFIQDLLNNPHMPSIMFFLNIDNFQDLSAAPLISVVLELVEDLEVARNAKSFTNQLSTGLILVTAASILVVAMSDRIEKGKTNDQHKHIQSILQKDGNAVIYISKPDSLARIILIFAAAIAIIGIIGPISFAALSGTI